LTKVNARQNIYYKPLTFTSLGCVMIDALALNVVGRSWVRTPVE